MQLAPQRPVCLSTEQCTGLEDRVPKLEKGKKEIPGSATCHYVDCI